MNSSLTSCPAAPCRRARHQPIFWPLRRSVPWRTRQIARRPRYGEASRFVTIAWSGWSGFVASAAGTCSTSRSNSGTLRFSPGLVWSSDGPAALGVGVDDREARADPRGIEVEEQVLDHRISTSPMRASGRSTLLMSRITGRCASSVLRRTKRVCGSGPSAASTSSNTPSTIASAALHLAAEIGVAGRVDDVDREVTLKSHRSVLGQNGDAFFPLQVRRVHDTALVSSAPRAGRRRIWRSMRVHERGLAVVDVRDDRDVPQVVPGGGHSPRS